MNHSSRSPRSVLPTAFVLFAAACGFSSIASADVSGDFTYSDDGTSIKITDYPEASSGAVVVPDSIAGKPVTTIGSLAFLNCSNITSVSLPSSVNLIEDQAFVNCSKMTSVNIPDGVPRLGYNIFAGCFALVGITIPSSVTLVDDSAFSACKALVSITIPPTVTSMGHSVFYDCNALANVALSPNVTSIGQYQFFSCDSLVSITIPAGVASIDRNAFQGCFMLGEVNFKGNAPTLGTDVFLNAAAGFHVNFYNGNTGFTTPTWNGYDAVNVGDEPFPEIEVKQPGNDQLADGVVGKSFGNVAIGGTASLEFTIKNAGDAELTGLTVTKSGTHKNDYQLGAPGATSLAAGESTTFTVSFQPTAAGIRTATIQIGSNDGDENPFDIGVTGVGLKVPEIGVEQPEKSGLMDGKSTKSFGTAVVGEKGMVRKFFIRNTGAGKLTGLAITKNGAGAGDFMVTQPAEGYLTKDGVTTFKVTFKPTRKGDRAAEIHIRSNDGNENTFDIKLAGMGVLR